MVLDKLIGDIVARPLFENLAFEKGSMKTGFGNRDCKGSRVSVGTPFCRCQTITVKISGDLFG